MIGRIEFRRFIDRRPRLIPAAQPSQSLAQMILRFCALGVLFQVLGEGFSVQVDPCRERPRSPLAVGYCF